MKRLFKVTLWTVSLVMALLIAAVIIVLLTFDPNKYKSEIAAAVNKATGRELAIQGDLKLSLFPWLGVETGAMTLSNAPGFGPEPFAKIGAAAAKVKLLPLLRGDGEVDTVTLDGLYLNLARAASGRTNWDDLLPKESKETAAPPASTTSAAATAVSSFAIGGIRLNDATLIWNDLQNKRRYELNKLSLHTGPIAPKAPVTLELDTGFKSTAPALNAQLGLNAQASYDPDTRQLQLKALKVNADAHGQDLPAPDIKLTLSSDALLKLADEHYQMSGLQLRATLHGDKLPGKQIDAALSGNVALDLKKDALTVESLAIEAWNLKINGRVQGHGLRDAPRFSGTLAIPNFNARDLLGHFGTEALNTVDKQALSAVSADVEFNASTTDAELTKLDAKMDQTQITGKASVKNFAHPAYRFQLALDAIDADRYLPPATAANAKPATPAAAVGAGAAAVPLATLRALDVDGTLAIGKLKIAKLRVNGIKAGVYANAGVIRASPLAAQLYGGSYRGDIRLDARGKELQLAINEALSGIELGPLTKDLLEKELVAGTGDITLRLTGTGTSPDELKRTLNGTLGFNVQNGRVNGVNLLEMIQKDYLKYIQGLAIDAGRLNQTVFSKFAATASVSNGLITTGDLALNSAQLNIKVRGTVNLVNEQLALRLDAIPAGQFAKQLDRYKDTAIPVRVEGTISAPKFATDLDEALKQKAKARLNQEQQKLKAELEKKSDEEKARLKEKLQNKLKGLFK